MEATLRRVATMETDSVAFCVTKQIKHRADFGLLVFTFYLKTIAARIRFEDLHGFSISHFHHEQEIEFRVLSFQNYKLW